jgi:hypothetical protein
MSDIQPTWMPEQPAALGKGPDPFGKKVCERLKKARNHKMLFKELFEDGYDYGFPSRPDFDALSIGERRTDLIFDDTLVQAIPEFASELQAGLVPNQGEIARLIAGPTVPYEMKNQVQGVLDEITDFLHVKLRESNFAEETHEAFMDLALSTLNMTCHVEGTLGKPVFRSIPPHMVYIDIGPNGKPDGRYIEEKVKYKHIEDKYPGAQIPPDLAKNIKDKPDAETTIIEGVWRDWSFKSIEVYDYFVVIKDTERVIKKVSAEGRGANPWITARWSVTSGEAWGRGLVMNVMPTVKSLNLVLQLILENAQVAIGGIWQYDSDGTINPDTIFLEPGTFIPRAPGSRIDPLESSTRFDVAQFVIEDARSAIRKGMLVDMLDQEGKTPVSATQVGQEISKFSRRMGASYNRLLHEYVFEVFHRLIWEYSSRGIIEMPTIDGDLVEMVAVSPLARAQNADDITDFTRALEVTNFAYGPQTTQMALKPLEGIEWIFDKTGADKRLIKSAAQIQQEMEAAAQLAQQQPELAEQITNATK